MRCLSEAVWKKGLGKTFLSVDEILDMALRLSVLFDGFYLFVIFVDYLRMKKKVDFGLPGRSNEYIGLWSKVQM